MTAPRTTIAGIAIPDSGLAREATEFVRDPSKDQPRDLPRDAGDVGGVVEDAAQGIRHRGHLAAGRREESADAVPARRVGEGAVDEDDGQRGVEGCLGQERSFLSVDVDDRLGGGLEAPPEAGCGRCRR